MFMLPSATGVKKGTQKHICSQRPTVQAEHSGRKNYMQGIEDEAENVGQAQKETYSLSA